jgi:hypothetical protein
VGLVLGAQAIWKGQWRRVGLVAIVAGIWVASFLPAYVVSRTMISPDTFLEDWWDFAFFRPPRSIHDLKAVFLAIANVLVNPVGLTSPLGPHLPAFLGLALVILGGVSLVRRGRAGLAVMLLLPLVLALAASMVRAYPFHGRLLLFTVPGLLIVLGEGLAASARLAGRAAGVVLGVALLIGPAWDTNFHFLVQGYNHSEFDTHGDLRRDFLDEIAGLHHDAHAKR